MIQKENPLCKFHQDGDWIPPISPKNELRTLPWMPNEISMNKVRDFNFTIEIP